MTGTLEEGIDTSDATAVAEDIDNGKTAYVDGVKITGIGTILNGQTKTVTPTTSQQTITPDNGYNGITQVTVNAVDNTIDSNIAAGNIKKDVSILGVTGTYEGSGGGGSIEDYINTTLTDDNKEIIKQLPALDTTELTNFDSLFANLSITSLPSIDTSNGVSFNGFCSMTNLISLPSTLDFSNAYNLGSGFSNCKRLVNISNVTIDISKVQGLSYCFQYDCLLTHAPMFTYNPQEEGIQSVNFESMFQECFSLANIPQIYASGISSNPPSIGTMNAMVAKCFSLTSASILNILKMIEYTTDGSYYGDTTLFGIGLYWRQIDTLDASTINTYVTQNGWTTGLEDFDTYTIDTKLYGLDGETVVTNNLSNLITSIYNAGSWNYEEMTCNHSSMGEYVYNTRIPIYDRENTYVTNNLVTPNNILSPIKVDPNASFRAELRDSGSIAFFGYNQYDCSTQELEDKEIRFRCGNCIAVLNLTQDAQDVLDNINWTDLYFSIEYQDSSDEMISTESISYGYGGYNGVIDKTNFAIRFMMAQSYSGLDHIVVTASTTDNNTGDYYEFTATIADNTLSEDEIKIFNITLDVANNE